MAYKILIYRKKECYVIFISLNYEVYETLKLRKHVLRFTGFTNQVYFNNKNKEKSNKKILLKANRKSRRYYGWRGSTKFGAIY